MGKAVRILAVQLKLQKNTKTQEITVTNMKRFGETNINYLKKIYIERENVRMLFPSYEFTCPLLLAVFLIM